MTSGKGKGKIRSITFPASEPNLDAPAHDWQRSPSTTHHSRIIQQAPRNDQTAGNLSTLCHQDQGHNLLTVTPNTDRTTTPTTSNIHQSSLLLVQNVRWPRLVLPPVASHSEYANGTDTPDRYIMLSTMDVAKVITCITITESKGLKWQDFHITRTPASTTVSASS